MRQRARAAQKAGLAATSPGRARAWLAKGSRLGSEYAIYIFLGLMFVGLSFISPYFLKVDNLINVARQVSIGAILAFGMMIPLLAGEFDISIGAIMGLSSALTIGLIRHGMIPTTVVVLGVGLVVGFANGLFNTKGRIPSFIVTLSTGVILRGIIFLYTRGDSSLVPSEASRAFTFLGKGYVGPIPFLVVIIRLSI